jgi:hypothetical protein
MTIRLSVLTGLFTSLVSLLPSCGVDVVFAGDSPIKVDEKAVCDIAAGEERLARAVSNSWGTIVRWRGTANPAGSDRFSLAGLQEFLRYRFYIRDGSSRVEYLPTVPPNEKGSRKETVAEVLLRTPQAACKYVPVPTTGTPYATLYRYAGAATRELDSRIDVDLRSMVRSLFTAGDVRIVDLLQRPEVKVLSGRYEDVPNALKMFGQFHFRLFGGAAGKPSVLYESLDQASANAGPGTHGLSEYEIVLDRDNDYAVRHCTVRTRTGTRVTTMESTFRVARAAKSGIVPRELAIVVIVGQPGRKPPSTFREVVKIDFADGAPDEQLFAERSLVQLKRDYTIVNVGANGSMVVGETIPAAPVETDVPRAGPTWLSRWRVPLVLGNAALVLVLIGWFWRRRATRRPR